MAETLSIFDADPHSPYQVVSRNLPEAIALANSYQGVREGRLAPVIALTQPREDYYLTQIDTLTQAMNEAIRSAFVNGQTPGIFYQPPAEGMTRSLRWFALTGCYFDIETATLYGISIYSENSDTAIPFVAANLFDEDRKRSIEHVELSTEPLPAGLAAYVAQQREQFLQRLHQATKVERARRLGIRRVQ